MIAEIVATGEEIRSGALIDSNSAYIAAKLEETGVTVKRHNCVGDDLDLLIAAFKEIGSRADIAAHLLCQAGFDAYILRAQAEGQ